MDDSAFTHHTDSGRFGGSVCDSVEPGAQQGAEVAVFDGDWMCVAGTLVVLLAGERFSLDL